MFTIILISFLAGILTVLAPCVLPLLPVILGGGLAGADKKRPYIIIISLIVSLMLFTILLKASTLLIDIHPKFWDYFSGGILILFGITLLFPKVWSWFVTITGIERRSQKSLQNAAGKEGIWGPIGIGASLGPVFSSCNPTYSLLLATVLPLDITSGLIGLTAYFIGLGLILLLVTLFGRNILRKFTFFANPNGSFRKILGIILIIIGILVTFGTIKKLQTWVVENGNFSFIGKIEERLNDQIDTQSLKKDTVMCSGGNCQPKNISESGILMDIANAPEIIGIKEWINSNPLTMESLRGKVVLIDFWTYSCINCIRTQPYLNAWHEKYEKEGLVTIGIHAPEFSFEKLRKNVEEASQKSGIKYPIALDNEFKTWNAYDNKYWPAKYLIDQKGNIVYKHFGEGKYAETEQKIQELLGAKNELEKEMQSSGIKKTPETYTGLARYKEGSFETKGKWIHELEYIEAVEGDSSLALPFSAREVFLVMSGKNTGTLKIRVLVDNKVIQENTLSITKEGIYTVFSDESFQNNATLIVSDITPGIRLHAFTFGDYNLGK